MWATEFPWSEFVYDAAAEFTYALYRRLTARRESAPETASKCGLAGVASENAIIRTYPRGSKNPRTVGHLAGERSNIGGIRKYAGWSHLRPSVVVPIVAIVVT